MIPLRIRISMANVLVYFFLYCVILCFNISPRSTVELGSLGPVTLCSRGWPFKCAGGLYVNAGPPLAPTIGEITSIPALIGNVFVLFTLPALLILVTKVVWVSARRDEAHC